MSTEIVRSALLWCTIINYGLLMLWFAFFVLPHQWLYRLSRWGFHLTDEQVDAINYAGMALYKIGIILFNLVPYIALRIAA